MQVKLTIVHRLITDSHIIILKVFILISAAVSVAMAAPNVHTHQSHSFGGGQVHQSGSFHAHPAPVAFAGHGQPLVHQGFAGHAAAPGFVGHAGAPGFLGHAAAPGFVGHAAAQPVQGGFVHF